jgi:hypothetical protein
VFLAQTTKHVHMLVRSTGLAATMSRYLIRRIENSPGNASIFTLFSSITVSFVSKTLRPLLLVLENSFFILSMRAIANLFWGLLQYTFESLTKNCLSNKAKP